MAGINDERELVWVGCSLDDLRRFPLKAKQNCGYQLSLVQAGREPHDWRPMPQVGAGCREIRERTTEGIYRVLYVTKFDDRVYVLHSFTKKAQRTSKSDLDIARQRYREAQQLAERHRGELQ